MKPSALACFLAVGALVNLAQGQDQLAMERSERAAQVEALEHLAEENPYRYGLMLDEQRLEGLVQSRIEAHTVPPHVELRAILEQWFDVRQSIRLDELAQHVAEFEQEQGRVQVAVDVPSALAAEWRERILEGGLEAMDERMRELRNPDLLRILAPRLLDGLAEQDLGMAQELARLARHGEERLLGALQLVVQDRPGLLERAAEEGHEELALHDALRQAVLAAHEVLRPHVAAEGRSSAIEGTAGESAAALDRVVQGDIAITRQQLDQVRAELGRMQSLLADREAQRELIIEIQLSRLLGTAELYEW